MNTKTIKQSVKIKAPPKQVYEALMSSRRHTQFTGEKAKINRRVGGNFSCYDGYIEGINLRLEPGKSIIQVWRSQNWAKDAYSIVTFRLKKAGPGSTQLEFTQVGVPSEDYKAKVSGWRHHYWAPLKAALE